VFLRVPACSHCRTEILPVEVIYIKENALHSAGRSLSLIQKPVDFVQGTIVCNM
jgi:hypothetical protein